VSLRQEALRLTLQTTELTIECILLQPQRRLRLFPLQLAELLNIWLLVAAVAAVRMVAAAALVVGSALEF
jgi:hypothetical protein